MGIKKKKQLRNVRSNFLKNKAPIISPTIFPSSPSPPLLAFVLSSILPYYPQINPSPFPFSPSLPPLMRRRFNAFQSPQRAPGEPVEGLHASTSTSVSTPTPPPQGLPIIASQSSPLPTPTPSEDTPQGSTVNSLVDALMSEFRSVALLRARRDALYRELQGLDEGMQHTVLPSLSMLPRTETAVIMQMVASAAEQREAEVAALLSEVEGRCVALEGRLGRLVATVQRCAEVVLGRRVVEGGRGGGGGDGACAGVLAAAELSLQLSRDVASQRSALLNLKESAHGVFCARIGDATRAFTGRPA